MISRVYRFVLQGIDAVRCEIEADLTSPGTRKTEIVGLPEAAVNESINLAPAHLRKEGAVCDLPIAVLGLNAEFTTPSPARFQGSGQRLCRLGGPICKHQEEIEDVDNSIVVHVRRTTRFTPVGKKLKKI
ncbi:MAG: hypothetical protein ACYTAU_11365 [Planctomycetota bacterium]